jgi:2-dehydropantoate 2-reductase
LIVGAGATGGLFGSRLEQAGRDVTFLVRPRRAQELQTRGLRVSGLGEHVVFTPRLVTARRLDSAFDAVLLGVKAPSLRQAIDDLAPAVGRQTLIIPTLNGLHHIDLLVERFGEGAVLGGVAKVATTLDGNGDVTRLADLQSLRYGARAGSAPEHLARVHEALSGAGFVTGVSDEIDREMWSKWVFIAATGAVSVLMRGSVGEVTAVPAGADFARSVVAETASVAAAAGYPVPAADLQRAVETVTEAGSPFTSSLYRDMTAGHPTEAEHIFGDLVARAHRMSVPVPLLDLATLNLRVYERRRGQAVER